MERDTEVSMPLMKLLERRHLERYIPLEANAFNQRPLNKALSAFIETALSAYPHVDKRVIMLQLRHDLALLRQYYIEPEADKYSPDSCLEYLLKTWEFVNPVRWRREKCYTDEQKRKYIYRREKYRERANTFEHKKEDYSSAVAQLIRDLSRYPSWLMYVCYLQESQVATQNGDHRLFACKNHSDHEGKTSVLLPRGMLLSFVGFIATRCEQLFFAEYRSIDPRVHGMEDVLDTIQHGRPNRKPSAKLQTLLGEIVLFIEESDEK